MENPPSPENPVSPVTTPQPATEGGQSAPTATQQVDLSGRRALRQQELLAAKLDHPDPKHAVLGWAAIEMLDFNAELKSAMLEAAADASAPEQRLETLVSGMRLYGSTLKLAEKLT